MTFLQGVLGNVITFFFTWIDLFKIFLSASTKQNLPCAYLLLGK